MKASTVLCQKSTNQSVGHEEHEDHCFVCYVNVMVDNVQLVPKCIFVETQYVKLSAKLTIH